MSPDVRPIAKPTTVPRRRPGHDDPIDPGAVDLSVDLAGVRLANPITTASGCFASGAEIDRFFDVSTLGAIVVKSITLEPREGLPTPRMHETASGMLNAIGLQNPGVDRWLAKDLPWLQGKGVKVIVSIAGTSADDFREVARRLRGKSGIAAVEVNLSCPNVEHRGLVFACHPEPSAEVIRAVTQQVDVPVFAKLTPDVTDITEIARAVVDAGADGLSLINTTLGMAVDPETGRPRIANTFGGLSGPAVKPIAIRAMHQVHTAVPDVPKIGMGGVRTVEDVVEMLRVGATAVAIGTANFADPLATAHLLADLRTWMAERGITTVDALRGTVRPWR
jgi:dihydroorotate dehydrogenase (NAD+) catalytic subunit